MKFERMFIPLLNKKGGNSEVSSHFGHAPFFALYEIGSKKLTIAENKLDHSDAIRSPVDQIVEVANPTIVFALGMGKRAITLFRAKGIKLKTGPYRIVKEVIDNLDKLEDLTENCGH